MRSGRSCHGDWESRAAAENGEPDDRFDSSDLVQAVFDEIAQTFGIRFVPDLFQDMVAYPAYLDTSWELLKEDLALDAMDAGTKRIIALAISAAADGTPYILAYPEAFRGVGIEETLLVKVRFCAQLCRSFTQFLAGVRREYAPEAARVVTGYLRQGTTQSGAVMSTEPSLQRHDDEPAVSWVEKATILILIVLVLAAGALFVLL